MGYFITKNDNEVAYGVKELICDTLADVEKLPVSYKPGSSAFCIENSSLWILGTDKKWHEVLANGSGGSGSGSGGGGGGSTPGGSGDEDDTVIKEVIYDGGEI